MKDLLDRLYVVSLIKSDTGHGKIRASKLIHRRFEEIDAKLRQRYKKMDAADFKELYEDLDER